MIHEELLEISKPLLSERKVLDLVVGIKYTAVLLDNAKLGLAFTLKDPFMTKSRVNISTDDPQKLAFLLTSTSPIQSSVGLATINSASQTLISKRDVGSSKNLLDALALGEKDQILMIGLMLPLAWELHNSVSKIWAVEDVLSTKEGPPNLEVRPWWALDLILHKEKVSAILISGSAIGNKTIDHIIEVARKRGSKVALVGPSVPIFPDFWKAKGVKVLAASLIIKPDLALKLVKGGFGSKTLFKKGCLKKIVVDLEETKNP